MSHPPEVIVKQYTVEEVRQSFPKAYEKWSNEEDSRLRKEYDSGLQVHELAKIHQRQPGAIRSRLTKLGILPLHEIVVVDPAKL